MCQVMPRAFHSWHTWPRPAIQSAVRHTAPHTDRDRDWQRLHAPTARGSGRNNGQDDERFHGRLPPTSPFASNLPPITPQSSRKTRSGASRDRSAPHLCSVAAIRLGKPTPSDYSARSIIIEDIARILTGRRRPMRPVPMPEPAAMPVAGAVQPPSVSRRSHAVFAATTEFLVARRSTAARAPE
jgi:hypothetical protein